MKSLESGIKFHFENKESSRIFINGGVECADAEFDIYKYKRYSPVAYRPIDNWRLPTKEENDILLSTTDQMAYADNLAIKKLPDELVELFAQFDFSKCKDKFEVTEVFKGRLDTSKEINIRLNQLIGGHSPNKAFSFFRIVVNRPGIQTLSYKPDGKEYIGLHIDTSTGLDLHELDSSRNRISINIGKEARSISIINLRLSQVAELLVKEAGFAIEEINLDNIAYLFFKHFPEYPVVKLLQYPYEYYIAPTDNILHDGSTLGMKTQDVTLIYLGHFNLYL